MNRILRPLVGLTLLALLLTLGGFVIVDASASELVTLRSGNGPIGTLDPGITFLSGAGGTPLSPLPFTAADFAAACGGPNAAIVPNYSAWGASLPCDPLAQWIAVDFNWGAVSTLYCQPFDVETCCIERATLSFCWMADDALGDGIYGGPNLDGVYLNGVAVSPSINTGNYATETTASADVTGLIQCGSNSLQVYVRDAGFSVTGVIYSASLDIHECVVPVEESTWGSVKSLYR